MALAEGNLANPATLMHNKIATFVAYAIVAATQRGIFVVVEQPASSILWEFRPVKQAISTCGGQFGSACLGDYGAASKKPLKLWGTAPWLWRLQLKIHHVPKMTRQFVRLVHRWPTGVRGLPALQQSAEYPMPFCMVVAKFHAELRKEIVDLRWRYFAWATKKMVPRVVGTLIKSLLWQGPAMRLV